MPGGAGVAGCFNLLGLITATAAVNIGLCRFVVGSVERILDREEKTPPDWLMASLMVAATVSQAIINHRGIRLTTQLTNFSGYLILFTATGFTLLMLLCAWTSERGIVLSRLIDFVNFSGKAGDNTWPETGNVALLFAAWAFCFRPTRSPVSTAAAQMAEETRDPERNVPKSIWQAVLISGLAGWIMLSSVVLAAPDLDEAAGKGEKAFVFIIREAIDSQLTHGICYTCISVAMYLCGLACVTSASRLTWAMARDDGLPFARPLSRIGKHKTPAMAIWAATALVLGAAKVGYETISSVSAAFFYLAYAVPTACGLWMYGKWPRMGPWHLGRWYRPLAVICVLGCVGLLVLSILPTGDDNVNITLGTSRPTSPW